MNYEVYHGSPHRWIQGSPLDLKAGSLQRWQFSTNTHRFYCGLARPVPFLGSARLTKAHGPAPTALVWAIVRKKKLFRFRFRVSVTDSGLTTLSLHVRRNRRTTVPFSDLGDMQTIGCVPDFCSFSCCFMYFCRQSQRISGINACVCFAFLSLFL